MIVHQVGLAPSASPFVLFENHLLGATITATATAAGFSPASVATENTYQQWKAGNTGAFLTADFGALRPVDTFAMVAHNFAEVSASVIFGWRADTVSAWTYNVAAAVVPDAGAVAVLLSSVVSARQILVGTFGGPSAPTAPVCIGGVYAGRRLEFPGWVGPDFTRPGDAVTVDGDASLSLEGQYLGATIRRRAGRLQPRLSPLPRAWCDANLAPVRERYDTRRPFFFAPGPAAFPGDLVYGWRADGSPELRPQVLSGGRAVTIGMELDFYAS